MQNVLYPAIEGRDAMSWHAHVVYYICIRMHAWNPVEGLIAV